MKLWFKSEKTSLKQSYNIMLGLFLLVFKQGTPLQFTKGEYGVTLTRSIHKILYF